MADIINLRLARKARERTVNAAKAAQSRVRHGLTKAEKSSLDAERVRAERLLDGLKRETD
ncbi:DUF4169 family protein [Novosphingobium sp. Leaf2]|uniref:DUF4169 family protein n=1 Tax=Novosphingobium sp. Leaf2 TaxID=1735670 RepID=UPI0006FE4D71|nr:DUF4169 family protein [Novosphingobium sp. Leaf2]KQM22134.1 hypothetical protein ASE49_02185 [Novosphingobium sp. Leaf2]